MHGIPVSYKDIINTKDLPTTGGSKVLSGFMPDYDATVVVKLREAGAVMIGKCSTWEFADGAYGVGFPYPRNPWGIEHMVGGSSSGSGVAIAASLDLGSIGSDTGGSVRMPACLCGVVGIKGTFGRVSKHGLISPRVDHRRLRSPREDRSGRRPRSSGHFRVRSTRPCLGERCRA